MTPFPIITSTAIKEDKIKNRKERKKKRNKMRSSIFYFNQYNDLQHKTKLVGKNGKKI